ncbi:MAG: polysaccharide deacetylase family protein [bacterium]
MGISYGSNIFNMFNSASSYYGLFGSNSSYWANSLNNSFLRYGSNTVNMQYNFGTPYAQYALNHSSGLSNLEFNLGFYGPGSFYGYYGIGSGYGSYYPGGPFMFPYRPSNSGSKPANSNNQPSEPTVQVNIQIDADISPGRDNVQGLINLVDELKQRKIKATVFVTGEFANQQQLLITDIYNDSFEIALHGYYTGEQLATMSYTDQRSLLQNAIQALEGCFTCGTYKPVFGFRPQYFSQGPNTYAILDELGITYNCGFKVGQTPYVEGHTDDVWPFPMEGHDFCVLPISRGEFESQTVYLCDIAMANVYHMSAAEWGGLLSDSLDRAIALDEPLVILFHNWYTGMDETPNPGEEGYWKPFVDFLTEAKNKGASFVATQKLVEDFCN